MKKIFECEICGNTNDNPDFIKACELSHEEDMMEDIAAILDQMDAVESQVNYLKEEYGDHALEILNDKMMGRLKAHLNLEKESTAELPFDPDGDLSLDDFFRT